MRLPSTAVTWLFVSASVPDPCRLGNAAGRLVKALHIPTHPLLATEVYCVGQPIAMLVVRDLSLAKMRWRLSRCTMKRCHLSLIP
ncbi:hypothetical protein NKDENANG_02041 [Candidatus Entotheonellaceae bacterium PAL068K]